MIVFLNGKFVDEKQAKVSVFDHGFLYGDGIYETLRTYDGKIWQLDEHLKRLRKSARMLKIDVPWKDAQLSSWLLKLLKMNGFDESRIRITVTRGLNDFDFSGGKKPTLLMVVQKFKKEPASVYEKGVDVVLLPWKRILPEAKSISLLPMILGQQFVVKKKAYEGLFLGEKDEVLEGTITNVTAVFGNVLVAPSRGVLAGCTQEMVLKLAKKNGFKIENRQLFLSELLKADEVFLTNAPRGIIPVRSIDGKKIGNGEPGSVTIQLLSQFKAAVSPQKRK